MSSIYQCPVCKEGLEQVGKSFVCPSNHTFDVSREGYVNFLLVNQKNSKDPGDNALMVASRKSFLDKGFYTPLSDRINQIMAGFINPNDAVLDLGCGIGYYSNRLKKALINANIYGIDISKPAIQKASKWYPEIHFSIGSSFRLPILDNSVDLAFSIFAPLGNQELLRVLKQNGKFLLVRPGPSHLQELAALIYGKSELQGNVFNEDAHLLLKEKEQLKFEIEIKSTQDLMNLVSMTPYFWHLTEENKRILEKTSRLKTTVDFDISVFQKQV